MTPRLRIALLLAALGVAVALALSLSLRPPDRIAEARAFVRGLPTTMDRTTTASRRGRDPLAMRHTEYRSPEPASALVARTRRDLLPRGWQELGGTPASPGPTRFFARLDPPLVQALLGTPLGPKLPLRGSVILSFPAPRTGPGTVSIIAFARE